MKAKSKGAAKAAGAASAGKARSALELKAEQVRASWTEEMHASVLKKFPPIADLAAPKIVPLEEKRIETLQAMLAADEKRLKQDEAVYEGLRQGGIKKLSDYSITEASPAKALTRALEQSQEYVLRGRQEVASKRARLTQLQGGLVEIKAIAAPPKVVSQPVIENPKDVTWLTLPRDVLEACVMVAPKDDVRYYLNGVFLQSEKKTVRAVATNGHSLLVHSTTLVGDETQTIAPWLSGGVILPREGLALALSTIGKLSNPRADAPVTEVQIGYAPGHGTVALKDEDEQVVFKMRVVDGKYPDYGKVMEDAAFVLEGGERESMQSSSMDGTYVKQAVAVGAKLGAKGLTPFVSPRQSTPSVITFVDVPNAMFLIMGIRASAAQQMPTQALGLLGPGGIKGVLAALKATQTRQKKQLAEETSESERKRIMSAIAERDARIVGVLQAMNGKALEAPKPKAAPVMSEAAQAAEEAGEPSESSEAAPAADFKFEHLTTGVKVNGNDAVN